MRYGSNTRKGEHLKKDGTPDMRFSENLDDSRSDYYRSDRNSGRGNRMNQSEHLNKDGTPDRRFKENQDDTRSDSENQMNSKYRYTYRLSNANKLNYFGNTPGEHSGKYDSEGHHLKSDLTPDMRFKENISEFQGEGFEQEKNEKGQTIKTPKYKLDNSFQTDKIIYIRKRPATPYALYIKDWASQMKRDNEDKNMNDIFRELADQWNCMEEEEKEVYYDQYQEELSHYYKSRDVKNSSARKYSGDDKSYKKRKLGSRRKSIDNEDTDDEDKTSVC